MVFVLAFINLTVIELEWNSQLCFVMLDVSVNEQRQQQRQQVSNVRSNSHNNHNNNNNNDGDDHNNEDDIADTRNNNGFIQYNEL